MSSETHDVQKEVKIYVTVFGALLFLTVVTVGVSYLKLSIAAAIALALFIATIKASLVACYFMHLISEKKLIYFFLTLTVVFFFVLLLLPFSNFYNHLVGTERVGVSEAVETPHH